MPALPKPKWEAFAQLLAKGATYTEAAASSGFSEKSAKFQGCRMAKDPGVVARVAELQNRSATHLCAATGIDRAWVLTKLIANVERAMQAEPVYDKEGNPTGEYKYEGTVANQALALIGKELCMFSGQQQETKEVKAVLPQWLQMQLSAGGSMIHSPRNDASTLTLEASSKVIQGQSVAERVSPSPMKDSSFLT